MKIVNLFSGPGCGKSTTASGLFYSLKSGHAEVEMVTEYAKDMTWERRYNILEDQIYVFAKQQRRLGRLKDHGLDWVITDSPIPLGLCYLSPEQDNLYLRELVWNVFDSYHNVNFLIERHVPYNPVGRNQNETEACEIDTTVKHLLLDRQVPFQTVKGGPGCVEQILECLKKIS